MPWIILHICLLLPFLRLRSRQSLTVMRLSARKSYSCLEEKARRSDSRAASRVLVLRRTTEECNRQTVHKQNRPVFASSRETHLLSIRLSMHCLSLSSMSSCSVRSSTSLAPVLANRQQAKLSTDWASTSVQDPASLQARRTHLRSPPSPRRPRWRCCGGWELQTPPRRRWCPSLPWTHF